MANLSVFQFQPEKSVRVEIINGEPLFCLKDVAEILEIRDTKAKNFNLKETGVEKIPLIDNLGRKQEATFINEPNLYRVIFRSNKPEAVKFQDWIFEEVIPQIRQTGSYQLSGSPQAAYLNDWEAEQIRAAVKARSVRTGETTQAVYLKLHAFMETDSYLHICRADFQTALNFLASIENAPVFRQPESGIVISEEQIYQLSVLTRYAQAMGDFLEHLSDPLRLLGSSQSGRAYSLGVEPHPWICDMRQFVRQALPQMRQPKYIDRVKDSLARMN